MSTMRMDGWTKICLGLTTFEEVTRETSRDAFEIDEAPSYEESEEAEGKDGDKTASEDKELAKIDKKTMVIEGESAAVVDNRERSREVERA